MCVSKTKKKRLERTNTHTHTRQNIQNKYKEKKEGNKNKRKGRKGKRALIFGYGGYIWAGDREAQIEGEKMGGITSPQHAKKKVQINVRWCLRRGEEK